MAVDERLRTIIVDDETLAVERLVILCAALADVVVVGTATDGEKALDLIDTAEPDLLLLDISMPELDGIGVARALGGLARAPAIVFCTAFDQFAVEAFDVAATDYLLKPVTPERLSRAVARVVALRGQGRGGRASLSRWAEEFW
ncbi:MAG: response regulator, partial [Sphingomonas sp.]